MNGRALLLCPLHSNVDLLRYGKGIVLIDAEIPDSTLYLGVIDATSRDARTGAIRRYERLGFRRRDPNAFWYAFYE